MTRNRSKQKALSTLDRLDQEGFTIDYSCGMNPLTKRNHKEALEYLVCEWLRLVGFNGQVWWSYEKTKTFNQFRAQSCKGYIQINLPYEAGKNFAQGKGVKGCNIKLRVKNITPEAQEALAQDLTGASDRFEELLRTGSKIHSQDAGDELPEPLKVLEDVRAVSVPERETDTPSLLHFCSGLEKQEELLLLLCSVSLNKAKELFEGNKEGTAVFLDKISTVGLRKSHPGDLASINPELWNKVMYNQVMRVITSKYNQSDDESEDIRRLHALEEIAKAQLVDFSHQCHSLLQSKVAAEVELRRREKQVGRVQELLRKKAKAVVAQEGILTAQDKPWVYAQEQHKSFVLFTEQLNTLVAEKMEEAQRLSAKDDLELIRELAEARGMTVKQYLVALQSIENK